MGEMNETCAWLPAGSESGLGISIRMRRVSLAASATWAMWTISPLIGSD